LFYYWTLNNVKKLNEESIREREEEPASWGGCCGGERGGEEVIASLPNTCKNTN
jgi:hypothetical protein